MRTEKRKRFRCIRTATAEEFDEKVNAIYDEHPAAVVTFHPAVAFLAYAEWTEEWRVPETLADEYALKGVQLYCGDCPYFEQKNDMRVRYHTCRLSPGHVRCDQPACDWLYKHEIKEGRLDG